MKRRQPPRSVEEALRRAAGHGRRALAEAVAAARALLDAAALGVTGETAEARASLATLAHALDDLENALAGEAADASPLLGVLAAALDAEIARWELRASEDRDARAVLRAFLGLREVLWEMGVRGAAAGPPVQRSRAAKPRSRSRDSKKAKGEHSESGSPSARRVQRVQVQG